MTPIGYLPGPPGAPAQAYALPVYGGELWTIPTSNSTMRLLVTGKETNNAFAVVGTGGTSNEPIGFHYHREAHDIFLCIKGKLNVWADDAARSLYPGDFASVPPGTVHQYQIDSHHTEFVGLIIPGGWEEFFRFMGEPYSGPLFPTEDHRNPFEVLVPRLIAATEKFDMIPVRDKASFDPQPWDGSESKLPGKCEAGGYFLKDGSGEKWVAGGTVVRPLATRKETDDKFTVYMLEGSKLHEGKGLANKALEFKETHHAVFLTEGVIKLVVEGGEVGMTAGETTFIPAGSKWRFHFESSYAKAYIFANGGGLGEVLVRVGKKYEAGLVPQEADQYEWDQSKLAGLEEELGFVLLS